MTSTAKTLTTTEEARTPASGLIRFALPTLFRAPMVPVLIAALLILWVSVPGFLSAANTANMALLFGPLLISALGITLVFLVGGIDLSIGSTLGLASVVAALAMRAGDSVLLGAGAGIALGAAVGALNGAAIAYLRLPAFVHTFGMLLTLRAVALLMTGGASVGRLPIEALRFGRGATLGLPNLLWLALVVILFVHLLLSRTRLGRQLYLTGANARAALFNGLPTRRVTFMAYFLCGTLSGLAGVAVVLRLGSGGPVLGDNVLLMAIAAAVLGGTSILGGEGTAFRTATGAAVIVLLDKGLNLLGLSFYDQAIVIGAVIVFGSAFSVWLHRRVFSGRDTSH